MNPQQNLLADLKDIHYPHMPSWWPLAPGWYVALALLLLAGIGVFYFCRYIIRNMKRRNTILKELQYIKQQSPHANLAPALSILLKRVAVSCYSREQVAGLKGEAWLRFLDKEGKTTAFTQGAGRLLLTAPYEKNNPQAFEQLLHCVEKWIRRKI